MEDCYSFTALMRKTIILFAVWCLGIFSVTAQELTINSIPKNYIQTESDHQGQVVRLDYITTNFQTGCPMDKHALVYLPYGYSARQKYNVFYLMHGGGTTEEFYLHGDAKQKELYNGDFESTKLQRVLDHAIEQGELEPLVVVCPSFYLNEEQKGDAGACTRAFSVELQQDLIPAVERSYSVYKGRDHRAFGGFSMGSVTTWYQICQSMEYFRYFLPMSGDCWGVSQLGGKDHPAETAAYVADAIQKSGYAAKDFNIITMTGSKDIAFPHLGQQIAEMRKLDTFRFDADLKEGNICYGVFPDGEHNYNFMLVYIYNTLPRFFK